jgi:hypothetical protein
MIEADLVEQAKRLHADGRSQRAIAAAIGKPRHWVRFTALAKSGPAIGAAPVAIDPHTRLEFHSLANLFPLIEDAEFDDLEADIKANGQHEDIVLLDDKVLDGRNRYRACLAAGFAPRIIAFRPEVHGEPLAFVISKNLKRRHPTRVNVPWWPRGSRIFRRTARPHTTSRQICRLHSQWRRSNSTSPIAW